MSPFVRILIFALLVCTYLPARAQAQNKPDTIPDIAGFTQSFTPYEGYFRFYWDERGGRIFLEIDRWDTEFLYVNSLSAGVGSNDLGLDRNQLGQDRVVKWVRSGPRVLLLQPNQRFRADSDNAQERQAVQDAFAQSVLAGFKVAAATGSQALIDLTPLLLSDAHGLVARLKATQQGTYKLDADRSMVNLELTKNFPFNSEFDALLTFVGEPTGAQIRSVTPTPEAVTVRMHHSLVQLPDAGYEPRVYDPRSGYFHVEYYDYATPIDQPLAKRFIQRHRLQKRDPNAAVSEPMSPIVYYLDRGVPEPIRSALLEGAAWWNEAFEAAGYRNAFRVEVLPDGADPMDVRYHVINWTHRSTRGWSYGSTVSDPRTGEIIKGHVLLGSLRVRQDFLIAQGLVAAYTDGPTPDPRLAEMALARLRQLSAHEVGHTLGLAHNFAASVNDRASVMDYPHPYIKLDANGEIDFSQAYATGMGEWDKQAIRYGYSDFGDEANAADSLAAILTENQARGLLYLSDPDARPSYAAHPEAHLWDNGQSAVDELNRLSLLRRRALITLGPNHLPEGTPMSELERVLAPLYLMHRYQVEAVAKLIGGIHYRYAVRGEADTEVHIVPNNRQREALAALSATLEPEFLLIPESVLRLIPPTAYGYERDRELFPTFTTPAFDPLAAAEAAADLTLGALLDARRLARLEEQSVRSAGHLSVPELLRDLQTRLRQNAFQGEEGMATAIGRAVEKRFVWHLLRLAADPATNPQVAGAAHHELDLIQGQLGQRLMDVSGGIRNPSPARSHLVFLRQQIEAFQARPESFTLPPATKIPDGQPIGCDH